MRNLHEQQNFQLKTIINRANERVSLFQIQKLRFICSIQQRKGKFLYRLCNGSENEHNPHQLTNSTSALSKHNFLANCNIILTILQSLVGFIHPRNTQSTKTLRNDVYMSTVRSLSQKYIFQCVTFMTNKLFNSTQS